MKKNELIKIASEIEALLRIGNLEQAAVETEKLLLHNRSAGLAYKGIISLRSGKLTDAEAQLLESFQLNPEQDLALANLIPTYVKMQAFKKAAAFGEQAYAKMPKNESVCVNFAAALLHDQKFRQAMEVLEPHLNRKKPSGPVLSGLISCYRSLYKLEEALDLLSLAEQHFPDKAEIVRLRADFLAEEEPNKALETFKQALELDPDNVATRWNMSLVQLRLRQFEEGWINYDCGLLPEVGKIGRPLPKLLEGAKRVVDLEGLDPNKWTYLVSEQGIGDQVLFFGSLRQFLIDFPKTIVIVEKRLAQILRRSFPELIVYTYGAGPLAAINRSLFNGYVPIGSIQKRYRNSIDSYHDNCSPYLLYDTTKAQKYREIILQKTNATRIVGFSWKGGFWERAQRTKTLDIEWWDPIFKIDDVIFVSLQYGDVTKEKDYLTRKYKNVRWIDGIDFKKDIDSWFALACACDDVISVSTALVHFVGAAGKSLHLLLSEKAGPFIWGMPGDQNIAYPNVKIYRKSKDQEYNMFFDSVAQSALKRTNHETI